LVHAAVICVVVADENMPSDWSVFRAHASNPFVNTSMIIRRLFARHVKPKKFGANEENEPEMQKLVKKHPLGPHAVVPLAWSI
jgi:hypothetical protein